MVETPANFENELHLGMGAGSVSGLSWAGAEPGTWQFPGLSRPAHPKEAMALMPSLIINFKFTGLQLKCTVSGEQLGLQGAKRKMALEMGGNQNLEWGLPWTSTLGSGKWALAVSLGFVGIHPSSC